MRARISINEMQSGVAARDYLRLVKGAPHRPMLGTQEPSRGEACDILETIRDQNPPDDLDISIEGKILINQMGHDLEEFGLVPYWYTERARSRGEGIYPGVSVIITGDTSRQSFQTVEVSFDQESVRMRDPKGHEYVLPWDMVVPVEGHDQDRPYWFTALARERGEDLQVGDYVRIISGTDEKYELTDVFWEFGEIEVRAVGSDEYQGMPWRYIRPWEE